MTDAQATGVAAVALQERRACAACGASGLEALLEITGVPVHMGCTDQPPEQRRLLRPALGGVRALRGRAAGGLAPLDLVYQASTTGRSAACGHGTAALGGVRRGAVAATVVEVGGASGALAREYAAEHDVDVLDGRGAQPDLHAAAADHI